MNGRGGVTVNVYIPNKLYGKILNKLGNKSISTFIQIALTEYLDDKERNLVLEVARAGMYEVYKMLEHIRTTDYGMYQEFIKICRYCLEQEQLRDKKKYDLT